MIDITTGTTTDCEGFARRDFMKVGSLMLMGGITLPGFLRRQAAGAVDGKKDRAAILVFLAGGPSHQDIYDIKPENAPEYRGPFNAITTNVPGIQYCEHMPLSAKISDKLAVVRSVTHPRGDHEGGNRYMLTGWKPNVATEYPGMGANVAKTKGFATHLPPYMQLLGNAHYDQKPSGFLSNEFNPFTVNGDPNNNGFSVQDVSLPGGVNQSRMGRRQSLQREMDAYFREAEGGDQLRSMDKFYQRAYNLISSKEAKAAFDLSKEDPKLREEYGRNSFGQSCLLARRLVQGGVRFTTIAFGGWDTHSNNFNEMKNNLLPRLDRGVATLVRDLRDRGMLEDTMVIVMGEFGRTPKVNGTAGRDHWPHVQSVMLAGGGIKGGQTYGTSDKEAAYPKDNPVKPEDLAATVFHCLGVDPETENLSQLGRPTRLTDGGTIIKPLVA